MTIRPTVTMMAWVRVCKINAFKLELIIIQMNPSKKYVIVISLFSSSTCTASFASCIPFLPLRNLPGPNTEQVAEFRMAHNSRPIAHAVTHKYAI